MNFFSNLAKAAVAVVATPVALVVDVVSLPATAYDDKPAFGYTNAMLAAVGVCVEEAVKPERD